MTSELPVLSGQIPRKGVGPWDVGAVGAVVFFFGGKKRCHLGTLRQVLFQTLASIATSGSARNKLLSAGTNGTMEHSTWHNAMKSHTERGTKMYQWILLDTKWHLLLVHKSGKNEICMKLIEIINEYEETTIKV